MISIIYGNIPRVFWGDEMNLLAGIYIFLIVGLIIYAGITLVIVIGANYIAGQKVKEDFAGRIKLLRLNRMLKKRRITAANYLQEFSVHSLDRQIRNCETCLNTTECEKFLSGITKDVDLTFCPNNKDLTAIKTIRVAS